MTQIAFVAYPGFTALDMIGPYEVLRNLPGAEVRPLANSYHVATLDNDAPEIFDGTLAFIQKHSIGQQNG